MSVFFDMESDTWDMPCRLSQIVYCDFTSLCWKKIKHDDWHNKKLQSPSETEVSCRSHCVMFEFTAQEILVYDSLFILLVLTWHLRQLCYCPLAYKRRTSGASHPSCCKLFNPLHPNRAHLDLWWWICLWTNPFKCECIKIRI